jgi:O-antigen/teichoic acid export membrane protein
VLKKLIPKNQFAQNVIMLMAGTGLAQAIPIAIMPILTRLYTPEDFGLVALFVACSSILSTLATGRYELAITLQESDKEAANLMMLTIKLCGVVSLILTILIIMLNDQIAMKLGNSAIAPWLYLLPVSVFASGTFNAIHMWLNRCGFYKQMAMNRVENSGYNATINIGLGIINLPGGQIWAITLGTLFAAFKSLKQLQKRNQQLLKEVNWESQKILARRYQNHPKHILPGQLIGAVAVEMPLLIISSSHSLAITGFFSLAYKLVVMPTALIASAIGDVYRQRIAREYQQKGEFKFVYLKTIGVTALFAFPSCILMYLFSPIVFSVVFGEDWLRAGEYAQILVVGVFFQMTFTPLDKGAVLVGATSYIFFWQLLRLFMFTIIYLASFYFKLSVYELLWCFVLINIFLYLVDGWVGYMYAKG